jgi:hypothetical protein
MKSPIVQGTRRALVASVLLGLAPLTQVYAHQCSLSNVAGSYGYTNSGTIVSPPVGPFTAVGHVTLNESGTFSGAQSTSIAGNHVDETIQGTFTVNPDCTGSATVYVYHGTTLARTSLINIVWDIHGSEFRAILLTPGTNVALEARRMTDDTDD